MEEARRLDGQDRFLNAKCGKYWVRAGGVDEASEVFGLFTKVSLSPLSSYYVETAPIGIVIELVFMLCCRKTRRARDRTWRICSR